MPMSERIPAIISFNRISIGWLKANDMPGRSPSNAFILSTSSSWVPAARHSRRGFNAMKMSVNSMPIGSVATSAVPSRDQIPAISSGKASSNNRSIRVL